VPLTDSEVIAAMRLLGINDDLSDAEITQAIVAWTVIVRLRAPLEALGTFHTVAGQQEYDLFGTGQPFEGGRDVIEIYSGQGSGGADIDIFGIVPWLQNLGGVWGGLDSFAPAGHNAYVFNVPGDFIISDRIWAAFRERFNMVRFIRKEGRYGSPILLDPVPRAACTLMVRYTRPRTDAEVREDDSILLTGVEWRALEILARKYTLSAGVRIGDHEDKGLTAKMYWDMAREKRKDALCGLDGLGTGAWTFSTADRS